VLTSPGNQSNAAGDTVSLQVNATQPDGDLMVYDATNLPPGLGIDDSTGLISGTIDPTGGAAGSPNTVTVTASSQDLTASQTFTWTVTTANHAPVLAAPANQVNAAGDAVSLDLSATDADGNPLTYTASGLPGGLSIDPGSGTITGTLASSAASGTPYTVTVMASDGMASSSQTFTWTVNYGSVTNPGDQSNLNGDSVSLQIYAGFTGGPVAFSATGLPPGLNMGVGTGIISGTVSNTADTGSPYTVTVSASDGVHGASQTFTWTVARLVLTNPGDRSDREGTAVSLPLSFTDVGGTPTFSATGLPTGVTINTATGLISGTLGLAAHGSSPYQVTVTATDGTQSDSQTFVWAVTPRVALANPGSQTSAAGDSVSLPVTASTVGGTLSFSATGLPPGLGIDATTGLISGTIASSAGTTPYSVTVTANDGTSSSSQTFSWAVAAINLPAPGDQNNLTGDAVALALAAGYHGAGTLTYSATGLPPGLSINATTGAITGTISAGADASSPYAVTVTATDGTNTASQDFSWGVSPRVTVKGWGDQENAAGDSVSLSVTGSDAIGGTLSYSATGLPAGLSIDSTTGTISGTVAVGADTGSPYAVTVTATNAGGSATTTFTWTVTHLALANPGLQTGVDGTAVSLAVLAHDADGDALTYSATGLPSGLTINTATGAITGSLASAADAGSPYWVTVTAADAGHSSSQSFLWTVTMIGVTSPGDQTTPEGQSVSPQVTAANGAGGTLTYSAGGLPPGLSIDTTTGLISGFIPAGAADNGPYSATVAASNGTVSSSQTFTWTVTPRVTLTAPPDQSSVEGDSVSLQVAASEPGATLTYSGDSLPPGLSINSGTGLISGTVAAGASAGGPYTVTVTATDGTYSASQSFTWTIKHSNNTPPTLANPGAQSNAAGDPVFLTLTAADADNDPLTFTATGLPSGLSIDPASGAITGTVDGIAVDPTPYSVTVTVSDGNGGSASQTFSWVVNDSALSAQVNPISATEGTDTGTLTVATFTDANPNWQIASGEAPDGSGEDGSGPDYTATIAWGDGSTTDGTLAGANGSFTVSGDHTYAEAGSYVVSVAVTDGSGAVTTATGTATVAGAALTLTGGLTLGAVHGQSAALTLASQTDGNPNDLASSYTVTINWGDNSGSTAGAVSAEVGGAWAVTGSHSYASNGTYTVSVQVTDEDGSSATATSTVTVGDLYAGVAGNLTVASFTASSGTASSFTAQINWGDGSPTSTGTVTGSGGTFSVAGSHTYASAASYTPTVTVTGPGGVTLTGSGPVSVMRPLLTGAANEVVASATGVVSGAELAVFAEPDMTDLPSEFAATLDWGDKTGPDNTATVQRSGDVFHVLGSHSYAAGGLYAVGVTLSQLWGALLSAFSLEGLALVPGAPNKNLISINNDWFAVPKGPKPLYEEKGVLANDDNLPPLGTGVGKKQVRVEVIEKPKRGDLTNWNNKLGTFTYTPAANWNGSDKFRYEVTVGGTVVGSATVRIGTAYTGFTYYIDPEGDPKDSNLTSEGGLLPIGGDERKPALNDAFEWFVQQANGKQANGEEAPKDGDNAAGADILVLRASTLPGDETALWIRQLAKAEDLRVNSVETLVFDPRSKGLARYAATEDPFVKDKLSEAEGVFIGGGDQRIQLALWEGTFVQETINEDIANEDGVVGGSSAGMHLLGGAVYAPPLKTGLGNQVAGKDGITSREALQAPSSADIQIETGFITNGVLKDQNVITDTHFREREEGDKDKNLRGRMGRLATFLARMQTGNIGKGTAHGLAAEETTGIEIGTDGIGKVVGAGSVYFVTAAAKPQIARGQTLTYAKVPVVKLEEDDTFDLTKWKRKKGGEVYFVSAANGTITNVTDKGEDVYNN
jgi:cyanophycinase-like exopeptidase